MDGFNPLGGIRDYWFYIICVIAIFGVWKAIELLIFVVYFLNNNVVIT